MPDTLVFGVVRRLYNNNYAGMETLCLKKITQKIIQQKI